MGGGETLGRLVRRVRRQLERTAAPGLRELLADLEGYRPPSPGHAYPAAPDYELVLPLRLAVPDGNLSLLYAATVFGSPRDVTLDEIAIETFFPADEATAGTLRSMSGARPA